jgi:hypothetical protein
MDILTTIKTYATHALMHGIRCEQSISQVPVITFEGPDTCLTMNITQNNDETMVCGCCDTRDCTYEYEIGYGPNFVDWEVIEISNEGWQTIDNIEFLEPFIPMLNEKIMEFNLVKWSYD